MKKILKWFVIAAVVIIVLAEIFGGDKENGTADPEAPSVNTTPAEPPVQVTANDLLNAYKENEIAANQKYKGKQLILKARISSIEAGMGDEPYLVLTAGSEFEFSRPQAHLARGQDAAAAALKKGQQVTLQCIGNSEVAGTPMLKDCRVQSS
ncbi:OB-fold protein [Cupriavidus metallidurans]|jgi:tRNA_anti-like|uniref:tRNA_anti-like n=1 Tax=Cupriavidus metallidurans TaxID=119219 RepID=A0A482ISK8_9BURK|nr:hypothetical protein [Cupriavidus metallidurans]QBP10129.1 hypothetical protein DDF84_010355 [Cupriavidus metallidurans]QWC87205.1 hypothetical protein KB891_08895 [Cupriavidus metallidurans]